MKIDPIKGLENATRGIHDGVGKITQPVLNRYPLLFAFLVTFSVASVLHGFNTLTDEMEIFQHHPSLLVIIGVVTLTFTGSLYKVLGKK